MNSTAGSKVDEEWGMWREQLKLLSALHWILTFLLLAPACVLLMTYLLFTPFWSLPVVYCLWWITDWKTPERGGRKSQWMSKWGLWRHFRGYFPVKLLKTTDLDPNQNYIFGCHPHGIMSIGAFCNFGTEATRFSKAFPGIKTFLTTLNGNFRIPLFRDYLMAAGICSVNNSSIDYLLSRIGTGNAVVIVVGGAAEALNCTSKEHILTLKNRKGFIKKALTHGTALVPVYSFGENEIYQQCLFQDGGWKRAVQNLFKKWIGFAPCVFIGRGIFSSTSKGILPFRRPITTVVGKPILVPKTEDPSDQEIEKYHQLYINSLIELFEQYKMDYGLSEIDTLTIA
ncbi:diacylglycerol O-acyltransferase 2-like [Pleurodeles waltl]|uniref:diacylglycerol O-acyltransferase 2-like n=1 Tax=Pleurodeles waltl TaxID=8319 RepID=UPI00370970BE